MAWILGFERFLLNDEIDVNTRLQRYYLFLPNFFKMNLNSFKNFREFQKIV